MIDPDIKAKCDNILYTHGSNKHRKYNKKAKKAVQIPIGRSVISSGSSVNVIDRGDFVVLEFNYFDLDKDKYVMQRLLMPTQN